jgi:hypothetical protein
VKAWRAAALALAAYFGGALLFAFARRLSYPYDLEWMEGGMLCHALRLVEHQPIYGAPSVDFIPYLYTPGYPVLIFILSKIFGLGYLLGRAVSILAFAATLLLGYVYARREGGSRATAAVAMAIPCAAFVPTGAFYDLARPDSLFLALVTAALLIGWWGRRSHAAGAAAALLMIAGFFTKQTAAPFMLVLGLALLVASPRVAVTYGLTLAAVGLPSLWLENRASHGWFWTYVSVMHRKHAFHPARAFVLTPSRLLLLLGPAILTVPWAVSRRRTPGLIYAAYIAVAGIGAACISYGTQWAYVNALIPGVVLPAIAIGAASGRLLAGDGAANGAAHRLGTTNPRPLDGAPPRNRPAVVFLLLSLSLLCAPGGLHALVARVTPRAWRFDSDAGTGYDPRPQLPTARDRQAGDALIARLRAVDGDVLIPFHPFYATLAGKRAYLHRMGVLDLWGAGMPSPAGLEHALVEHRFALAVFDDKMDGNWPMWPGLQANYHTLEEIDGPHMVTGAPTHPKYVMVPTTGPGVIDRELQ